MRFFERWGLSGLFVGALALALVGCGAGGGGSPGPDADEAENPFAVIQEIPTNGQQVTGDLAQVAGERISIEFTVPLNANTIISPAEPFNRLSSNLNVLDNDKERVLGNPTVNGRFFWFKPSPDLTKKQYTITVSMEVKSVGGQTLDREFYTSFTVGEDDFEPIIRRSFPVQNQPDVPRDTVIKFTFNESLEAGSVNSNTVTVVDGQTNNAINGTVALQNNGFEIVFTPDPAQGLPPDTTVVVTLQGGSGGIVDAVKGKPFLDTQATKTYTHQFNTQAGGDPLNQLAVASLYFIDAQNFGVIDIANYTGWPAMPNSNGMQVLGDSLSLIGSPGEGVLDWRVNGAGDTFAYVVDRGSSSVAVVNTLNSRVVGNIFAAGPRGLSYRGGGLFVSEYASDSLAFFNLSNAQPGTNNWDADPNPNSTGSATRESTTQVGRGPVGVSAAPDQARIFVTNSVEATCTILDSVTMKHWNTFQVGANPQDVAVSYTFLPPILYFALVTNQGAGVEDPGSCSFWWVRNPGVQHWLLTGLKNPRGLTYDYNNQFRWFVANSGGSSASRVDVNVVGGTLTVGIGATFDTGQAPQNCAMDPTGSPRFLFTSDMADGTVTVYNVNTAVTELPVIPAPGVRWVWTFWNQ